MHVAFTIAGLDAGGAERVLSLITGAWIKDRSVTIITFDAPCDPIFHFLDPKIEIIRLGISSGGRGLADKAFTTIKRIFVLRRILRKLQPDVVISFLTKINIICLLASIGTKTKIIVSERNNPQMQMSHSIWHALLPLLHWRASAIVMQTRESLALLKGNARKRAYVINNPIEAPAPFAKRNGPLILAAVGRLTHQKGFDLLIEAFAAIAPSHPDWTLRIWGEGELRPVLERQVKDLGLEHRIELPGVSHSPAEWVCDANAFVFSSRYEGFGNALAEAAASGLAVVSFDCPFGPSDIIDHERTGLLVTPGDTNALSAALDRLMGDEALRNRLGEAARDDMSRFAPDKIIAQWDALLARTLSDRVNASAGKESGGALDFDGDPINVS